MNSALSPLILHIPFSIVNTYLEFQVYMFSNDRDMTKCHRFLHDDNDDTKAIAIPQVFSENRRAKNIKF